MTTLHIKIIWQKWLSKLYKLPWLVSKSTTTFLLIKSYFTCCPNHDVGSIFNYARLTRRFYQASNPRSQATTLTTGPHGYTNVLKQNSNLIYIYIYIYLEVNFSIFHRNRISQTSRILWERDWIIFIKCNEFYHNKYGCSYISREPPQCHFEYMIVMPYRYKSIELICQIRNFLSLCYPGL